MVMPDFPMPPLDQPSQEPEANEAKTTQWLLDSSSEEEREEEPKKSFLDFLKKREKTEPEEVTLEDWLMKWKEEKEGSKFES